MSVVVAEGVVEVTADAVGVPRQITKDIKDGEKSAGDAGTGLGKKIFGGVLAGWAAIGGITAVTGFFTGAVSGASDLNETMSASSAIFGDNVGIIDKWGDTAAKSVGMSKGAAIAAAASFGDMFLQIGFTGEKATEMSTAVVQAAADLGSFKNLETADVTERISAAFRGEYDSLQAVIPNINAARVESEAMAATGKKVASELTAQEKAAAVLAIVQKDGARAMGDFAATSDGAANAAKIATASFEDQQAKMGQQLLPMWSGFLGLLNDKVIPVFANVVEGIGGIGAILFGGDYTGAMRNIFGASEDSELVDNLFKVRDGVIGVVDTVVGVGREVGGWISENAELVKGLAITFGIVAGAVLTYNTVMGIARGVTAVATGVQWGLNAAMTANPIGVVITLLALLVGAIVWVATQTTFFQDAWANVTSFVGGAMEWLWGIFGPTVTAIGAVFSWLWGTILSPIFAAWGAIFSWLWSSVIAPAFGYISLGVQTVGAIFSWLYVNTIAPIFAGIGAVFSWIWNSVISPTFNWITGAIELVGRTIASVFGGIGDFMSKAFTTAASVVKGPINAIISLVNSAISSINKLSVTIPDWVPLVGGQTWGLDLPKIPMLARGSNNAPDMFIAGERGPELITGAGGATVRPYGVTNDLLARRSSGSSDEWAGVMALLAVLVEAVKAIPGAQVNAEFNFPDTDDGVVKARQAARELTKYLTGA